MSSARLCLAGLLVASGLVLGAFTLHGYFDPQWETKQTQAAGPRAPAAAKQALPALQGRNRFIAREEKQPASPVRVTTAASPSPTKVAAPPAAKPAPPRKKTAEKAKPPAEQQASFLWPWNLFNN
jgi:hypothetical protein